MSGDILIVAELEDGSPRRTALEIASKAADLAVELNAEVHAVALGRGASASSDRLGEYGVDVVHADDGDSLWKLPNGPCGGCGCRGN